MFMKFVSPSMMQFFEEAWMLRVLTILGITLILSYIVPRLFLRTRLSTRKKQYTFWDSVILDALSKPVHFLIWILGIF